MADINNVVLVGRLTRDAELKYTTGGQAVCKFSIAVNRRRKNGDQWEDEANFFDIVLWGRQGEALNQYLLKGKTVGVEGELRQDRWQQDGQNRSKVEIVADNIQLMGGNPGGGALGSQNNRNDFAPPSEGNRTADFSREADSSRGADSSRPSEDGFTDDIPF